jgi:hypothetical protein
MEFKMLSVLKCHGQLISAHAKGYNKHSLGVVHPTAKIANKCQTMLGYRIIFILLHKNTSIA